MAKRKKTGGRDFVKGNPGGPGKPTLDPRIRNIRKLTADEFELVVTAFLRTTKEDAKKVLESDSATLLEKIVIQVLTKTHNTGNMGQFDLLLNRIIGRVKEQVDIRMFKPSIIKKRDGSEVVFTQKPIDDKEDE